MTAAGRVLLIFKDEYSSTTTYDKLDVVMYDGSSYVAKQTTTGNLPTNKAYWQILAKGDDASIKNIVDETGTTLEHRSKIKFINAEVVDDPDNDCTVITVQGGGGVSLENVSGATVVTDKTTATIKWSDPGDVEIDGTTLAAWGGTLVLRKAGSAPQNRLDGEVVVDSTTRNAYSSTGFVDAGLNYGTTYYYRFFPYSTTGSYTNGSSVSATPTRTIISTEPSQTGKLNYDGNPKMPSWNNYDLDELTIGGDTVGTAPGTYTATFTPKSDYCWSDGSQTAKGVDWVIDKMELPIPVQNGSLVYDGTEQEASFTNFDSNYMTVSGNKGTTIGKYTATFALKDTTNTKWATTDDPSVNVEWTINDAVVDAPSVSNTTLTYDRTEQGPTIGAYDSSIIEVTGDKGTDAGNYTVTMHLLNANYKWSDETTADKTVLWTISPKPVAIPTVTGSFTYDGNEKEATVSAFDSNEVARTGDVKGTNAGTYTVNFALTNTTNYKWSDNTTNQKPKTWTIAQAARNLSLTKSNMSLDAATLYEDFTASFNGDGTLTVSSNDTSVAKVALQSGKTYRVTAVGNGSATITVSIPATTNYLAGSATISVKASLQKDLSDMSWSEISAISAAGTASANFSVGDYKKIKLNGTVGTLSLSNVELYVYIIGIDHNSSVEGSGITFGGFKAVDSARTDVCLVDSNYNSTKTNGTKTFNMNHWGNNNYGGWKGSDLRYDILGSTEKQPSDYGKAHTTSDVGYDATSAAKTSPVTNTLMAALPSDLRTVLKPITKYTDNTGNKSNAAANVTASVDYLPLLSEFEIQGTRSYANENEKSSQKQYAYYANGNSKVKRKHSDTSTAARYWCRSAHDTSAYNFCNVYTDGGAGHNSAHYSNGLAPALLV